MGTILELYYNIGVLVIVLSSLCYCQGPIFDYWVRLFRLTRHFYVFLFLYNFLICVDRILWQSLQDFSTYMWSSFPFEFDIEIERTFHSRRKKLKLEDQRAKAQEASSTVVGGGDDQRRMLRDFIISRVQGITSSIARPNLEAHNFELKLALISIGATFPIWRHPARRSQLTHLGILRGMRHIEAQWSFYRCNSVATISLFN